VKGSKRDQNAWQCAVHLLEKSQDDIYVQATGDEAGSVKGIPIGIKSEIYVKLNEVAKGIRSVTDLQEDVSMPSIQDSKTFRNMRYRDSKYALLAVLWQKFKGVGQGSIGTTEFQSCLNTHTDEPIMYDHRTNAHGVWSAKKSLVELGYINEQREHREKQFSLTLQGAKLCYQLFNNKFSPEKLALYVRVEPQHVFVDENGLAAQRPQTNTVKPDATSLHLQPPTPPPKKRKRSRGGSSCSATTTVNGHEKDLEGEWACSVCTLLNNKSKVICEVCMTARPPGVYDPWQKPAVSSPTSLDCVLLDSIKNPSSFGSPMHSPFLDFLSKMPASPRKSDKNILRGASPSGKVLHVEEKQEISRTKWSCFLCTFENDHFSFTCDVCGMGTAPRMSPSGSELAEEKGVHDSGEGRPAEIKHPSVHPQRLWLVVDSKERKNNKRWKELLENLRKSMQDHCSTSRVTGANLHIGDYIWVRESPSSGEREGLNEKQQIDMSSLYPMIVERKCIADLVERSAHQDCGPHFRQERDLRYSEVRHTFLLIEGDGDLLNTLLGAVRPRVGNQEDVNDLTYPDVVDCPENVIRVMAGVVARNIGAQMSNRVLNLQTANAHASSLLLAALTIAASSCLTGPADQNKRFNFKDFNFSHRHQVKHAAQYALEEALKSKGVTEDFAKLVVRRFGSLETLRNEFNRVTSHQNSAQVNTNDSKSEANRRALLLCNLTHGGANVKADTTEEILQQQQTQAVRVYEGLFTPSFQCIPLAPLEMLAQQTEIKLSGTFFEILGCAENKHPAYFQFEKVNDFIAAEGLTGADFTESSLPKNQGKYSKKKAKINSLRYLWAIVCKTDHLNNRCSGQLLVLCVPPAEVLVAFAMARTMIQSHDGEAIDYYLLVRTAWQIVVSKFPQKFPPEVVELLNSCANIQTKDTDSEKAQLVVIFENIGVKSNQGVRGSLNSSVCNAPYEGTHITIGGDGELFDLAVLQEIGELSYWLFTLLIAYLSHDGTQVFKTKNEKDTKKYMFILLHEIQRVTLMNKVLPSVRK